MSFAFQPFFTGDYYRDTRHLSMLQHGAYRQLLDHCWDQKGPLPLDVDKCYRICGAVSKEEQDCVRGIVAEFFVCDCCCFRCCCCRWCHKRCLVLHVRKQSTQ